MLLRQASESHLKDVITTVHQIESCKPKLRAAGWIVQPPIEVSRVRSVGFNQPGNNPDQQRVVVELPEKSVIERPSPRTPSRSSNVSTSRSLRPPSDSRLTPGISFPKRPSSTSGINRVVISVFDRLTPVSRRTKSSANGSIMERIEEGFSSDGFEASGRRVCVE